MTLISYSNSEGTRRCDARCYNAHGPKCECICGGKNHGAGLVRAMEQTRQVAEALAEKFVPGAGEKLRVQLPLL